MRDRLIKALNKVDLKNPALERKTGVKSSDWRNVRSSKIRVNQDHLEGLCKVGPEYVYWVVTGKVLTSVGQISPDE